MRIDVLKGEKKMETRKWIEQELYNFERDINKLSDPYIKVEVHGDENPVINLLNYFRMGILSKCIEPNWGEYSIDNKFFKDEDAFGDVAISFWTPYSRLMKNLPESRKNKKKTYSKNYKHISKMIEIKNRVDVRDINNRLSYLAENYYSRGNLLALPNSSMNNKRYELYEDRIDLFLENCLCGGEFSVYFKSRDELLTWIKKEELDCLFKNESIGKKNLIRLCNTNKLFSEMTDKDIAEYIDNASNLIKIRNERFDKKINNL